MKRSQEREKAMIAVYQYLLVNRDVDTLIEDTYERKKAEVDPYFTTLVHTAIDNAALYEGYINDVLKEGWKFARLGAIEKAILLCGCSEFEIKAENLTQIEISEEIFKNIEKYEFKNGEIVLIENFETLKAKEARKEEILNQLKEIDNKSIRALRANEQERLNELEAQAVELRKELQEL